MIASTVQTAKLLVVSRDSAVLRFLWSMGESNPWQIDSAANAWEAMERIQSGFVPDFLLLDLSHRDEDGLHILRCLRRLSPSLPVVLIGYPDGAGRKQEAIRIGARAYLTRPIDNTQLEVVIRHHLSMESRWLEMEITSDDIELIGSDAYFIGISPIMRMLRAQAALLAEANVPVLILGEGGSGKDTTARLVHKLSVRSGFEFAKVNCAVLPSDLLERELFGYTDGNSMAQAKPGKLERCAKGTILLDEITEMSMSMQANLLQVLQNNRFVRPGTSTFVEVDVRVIASSTTNMEHAVSEKRLLEDLYYRLSAYTIHVPALRERKEELPLLSRHFMHQLARHYGLPPRELSPASIEACQSYPWPGNLRELESFVKRYLMVGNGEPEFEKRRSEQDGRSQHVSLRTPRRLHSVTSFTDQESNGNVDSNSLRSMVQSIKSETEKKAIATALEKTKWNRKAAARLLKVSYRTLLYKIEHYQMRASDSTLLPGADWPSDTATEVRGDDEMD